MSAHQDSAVEAVARAIEKASQNARIGNGWEWFVPEAKAAIAAMPTDTLRTQRDELLEALERIGRLTQQRQIVITEKINDITQAAIARAKS